jgi:putative heme-binding domain-containing protein
MRRTVLFLVASLCIVSTHAADKVRPLDGVVAVLGGTDDIETQRDILRGLGDALAGRRKMTPPAGWGAVHEKLISSKDAEVRSRTLALSILFGDPQALALVRKSAEDTSVTKESRATALETLLDARAEGVPGLLRKLLDDKDLRRPALRGLARYGEASTPADILTRYPKFTSDEKSDALATLASRPNYALALLDAMEKKRVPTADLSAFQAQQIARLNNAPVTKRLAAVWGSIRPAAKDRLALTEKYKKLATPAELKKANLSNGRAVFAKNCASCHVLFGEGAKIGPELTGSQRANPEYILHKVLDPNAAVPKDAQVTQFELSSGRVLSGLVKEETAKVVVVQTPTEVIRILASDIEKRETKPISLMPEGILAPLSNTQVRDLLAYLAGKGQVALPK